MQDVADRIGVSKALGSLIFRRAPGPSEETRRRVFTDCIAAGRSAAGPLPSP